MIFRFFSSSQVLEVADVIFMLENCVATLDSTSFGLI